MIFRSVGWSLVLASLATGCSARTPPRKVERAPAPVRLVEPGAVPRFADPDRRAKLASAFPEIEALVEKERANAGAPAMALGVVVDGELAFVTGKGARDLEKGGDVNGRTVFRIGSITKIFTAMAAQRLAADHTIDLDAPAERYLPELARIRYPSSDAGPFTVRQMMTYSSGLPLAGAFDDTRTDRDVEEREVLDSLSGASLVSAPGSEVRYSNLAFGLLGILVGRAAHEPFRAYVTRTVLGPLGMRQTVWSEREVAPGTLATAYAKVADAPRPVPHWRLGASEGSGGLYASVDDMARFVAFQLDAWPPRSGPEQGPLRRAAVRESHRGGVLSNLVMRRGPDESRGVFGSSAGLGWWIHRDCDFDEMVVKDGGMEGYRSAVLLLPDRGVGIIAFANYPVDMLRISKLAASALSRTGGLARRTFAPSPRFVERARALTELYNRYDEGAYLETFTPSFRAQVPEAQWRSWMKWQDDNHGRCRFDRVVDMTGPDAGSWIAVCDRGSRRFSASFVGPREPRFDFIGAESIREIDREIAEPLRALLNTRGWTGDDCKRTANDRLPCARLASGFAGQGLAGARCEIDRAVRGDGKRTSTLWLRCNGDRPREVALALEISEGRVTDARVRAGEATARCDP